MENTEKRFNSKRVIIIGIVVIVIGVFFYNITSPFRFRVYTHISDDKRYELASLANGGISAGCIERYGERGPMDPDYLIESHKYESLATLTSAIPSAGEAVRNGTSVSGTDLKGRSVKKYQVSYYCPAMDEDESDVDLDSQKSYWSWSYNVLEYPDGSYRYSAHVCTC